MPHRMLRAGDTEIAIETEPGKIRLLIDGGEIRIRHHQGKGPFSSPYLPGVAFGSLENLAKALVQHRFPGGDS